jgi:hypothetical protein
MPCIAELQPLTACMLSSNLALPRHGIPHVVMHVDSNVMYMLPVGRSLPNKGLIWRPLPGLPARTTW